MEIRIDGRDLPGSRCAPSPDAPGGYDNVHVGVQRRGRQRDQLVGMVRADAPSATWRLSSTPRLAPGGADLSGPCIQGPPGGRFIYLSWGTVDRGGGFRLFRRAKLWLDAVDPRLIERAAAQGVLIGRLGLTDRAGNPLCAAIRPPLIEWSVDAG